MTCACYTTHSRFFSLVTWGKSMTQLSRVCPSVCAWCGHNQRAVHSVCQHTDKPLKPQQKRFVHQMYSRSLVLVHFIWFLWNSKSPRAPWKGDRLVHLPGNHVNGCVQENSWYRVRQSYFFWQAWKKVVPTTNTRCVTKCFCAKPAISLEAITPLSLGKQIYIC